ncbi:SMI1/KNR4 family protein [Actinomadura sp. 7K507]|uniref:SMI1/KNR4 family protein n=1 Tax=Actinomadura sp. 7K507 TaxID=2530365 RepID=UPI001051E1AF|nr:SMI1/KNR4 family protein [Actinomadura sp. 7K507]TDC81446.1 SMI1/KNR4 family protein [Actinomadura sp. 7K507]
MQASVDESWNVIVEWLRRNAPSELMLTRPPVAENDIREVERGVGTVLPEDLVAWWRRTDGQGGHSGLVPSFYTPYSAREALDRRKLWMTAWNGVMEQDDPARFAAAVAREDQAPAGTSCKGAWLPRWLPIAGSGGGNDLFVDLRSGPAHGCVREFARDDGASDSVKWDGVAAMLADVAAGLARDVPVHGHRVWVEDDGRFTWDSAASRWSIGGRVPVDVGMLRERYAAFVAEARMGDRRPPADGSWPAEWIAAHVVRNTELLLATTQAVLAADPAADVRYDNSDAMAPATLDRYASSGLAALAGQVEQLGARLCELVEPLNRGKPIVDVRVVDGGATVLDMRRGWLGVLNALRGRQLPLRTRQLRVLR